VDIGLGEESLRREYARTTGAYLGCEAIGEKIEGLLDW
jgi:hypothetical protein